MATRNIYDPSLREADDDELFAFANDIYDMLGLGWRPYPENTPTHSGQYIVQLKDNDVILAEWVEDVADPYFYYRNDAEIVAYREYIPYQPESED